MEYHPYMPSLECHHSMYTNIAVYILRRLHLWVALLDLFLRATAVCRRKHEAAFTALEQTYPSREDDVIVCFHSLRDVEAREGVDKVSFSDIAGAQRVSRSGSVSAPVLGASRLTGES